MSYSQFQNAYHNWDEPGFLRRVQNSFEICKGKWDNEIKLYVNTTCEEENECCKTVCKNVYPEMNGCYQICKNGINDEDLSRLNSSINPVAIL